MFPAHAGMIRSRLDGYYASERVPRPRGMIRGHYRWHREAGVFPAHAGMIRHAEESLGLV